MKELFLLIVGAFLGYGLGLIKAFWEEKQRTYKEILPPIQKMAYHPEEVDEREFNKALGQSWLYGSKDVAMKMDKVVSIMVDPSRGSLGEALQETVAAMRKDIQLFPWQRLKPKQVNHLYARLRHK